ncbi:PREDICTED: diphthine--ammonia ligase isoform X1 [Lupinus angustifolius]|uniref:diphthine--ammonia ligase isoform X1 n=1 Tax=Lupinus angustifolius TaxID=3871 RepID=UPI00092FAAD8|nr:PREDICTED: diphthine--ammonia ligase isoform X1 [Lupinus angustifolius]
MKVVALVSGGKDSCYAMMKCIQYGHQIVALANLLPVDDSVDELDSYMYQTVGHQIVVSYAECMGLPLFRRRIQGSTRHQELGYRITQGDEVEDMFNLLCEVKRQIPSVNAVSSGAIASDYQRLRVESVCSRLGFVSLAYLWRQDQSLLLQEMIANGIVAVTVKVAAMGLDPAKHLGKELAFLNPYLHKLKELYGINVCGEGGEYETLTLDCPLFTNARIVLDEYEVVRHSSDSIAPVGVLHPLAFHLENKEDIQSLKSQDKINEVCTHKLGSVFEVIDNVENFDATCKPVDYSVDPIDGLEHKFIISRTNNKSTFSLCCWLQDSCNGLQEDLKTVLEKVESQLASFGFGWENVIYIHLYIDDMNKFSEANETYVRFITQEKCPFGVPSRSTVEMPLVEMGLSRAYIEVLIANNKDKKVLHVQSISSWAPSCIGPYSQATLHEGILHMAGQLGLDPPTMNLCNGGPSVELEQALKNSEAVAKSFNCSISTSSIAFVVYCSKNVSSLERLDIQEKQETILRQMKISNLRKGHNDKVLDPMFLYVLVPDLPKRAYVEVKPVLYVEDDTDVEIETNTERSCSKEPYYWGFKQEDWHDSCIQKCVVPGKICASIVSITREMAAKICFDSPHPDYVNDGQYSLPKVHMEKLSKFCVYLLNKVISDHDFSWEDIMNLRFYIPASLQLMAEELMPMFSIALSEFAEMSQQKVLNGEEPIFNIVPVLGAGRAASSMDDVVTCELLARKS